MIELGVEPQRKSVIIAEEEPAHYLILGDFGSRATEPLAVDRNNLNLVMAKLQITLDGAAFRELDDFHPDHLFRNVNLFREIDPAQTAALGERMRGLLHDPRFQAVEAAWRGLDFVIRSEADDDPGVRIRVAQLPKAEAARDLLAKSLGEISMQALLGAHKWRAVIGLYAFGPDAADIEFLSRMARLTANIGAPFIAEGSADMGDRWAELRALPEASYLGLALPRFLLRLPYGERTSAIQSFPFEEMPGAPVHAHFLWGNPALAFLALLTADGALNLEGLPVHTYEYEGEWHMSPCSEVWMTETQIPALIDLGMMPLVSFRDSDRARLAGFRAINGEELALRSA
jgi:type VI secretion system protein ImpC